MVDDINIVPDIVINGHKVIEINHLYHTLTISTHIDNPTSMPQLQLIGELNSIGVIVRNYLINENFINPGIWAAKFILI